MSIDLQYVESLHAPYLRISFFSSCISYVSKFGIRLSFLLCVFTLVFGISYLFKTFFAKQKEQ
jgi:hypothetical protein